MESWLERRDGLCRQVVVTGFHGLWCAFRDPELRARLNAADLWVPDGIAPVWIARSYGFRAARRAPGAELMAAYFQRADAKGYSSFFLGDTDETLTRLSETVSRRYPGHRVAGTYSPPFGPGGREADDRADDRVIEMINAAKPDVLWVALGMPKQEQWIAAHVDRLQVPIAAGVGAAFGFIAGTVRRAPAVVGDLGLEWAWRLAADPRRTYRRVFFEGPPFVACVLLERLGLWTFR